MKIIAITLAIAAGLMFLLPLGFYLFYNTTYDFTEYATFVGGTAGPLAALAGFLFIYLTFQHQQGQLDKLEEQSFEIIFFKLLDYYRGFSSDFTLDENGQKITLDKLRKNIRQHLGFTSSVIKAAKSQLVVPPSPVTVTEAQTRLVNVFYKHKEQLHLLISLLMSVLDHIHKSDRETKEKYLSILEFQIPASHLNVYFYFYVAYCRDLFDLEDRIRMYKLLNRINPQSLYKRTHKQWIEDLPYNPFKETKNHNL